MKRRLLRIAAALALPLVAIVITIVLVGNNNGVPSIDEEERLLPVTVLPVIPGVHAPSAEWTGRVVARQTVELSAPVAADVQRILAREGDSVQQGAALIELDTRLPRWDLAQIEADLQDFAASIAMAHNQHRADQDMLTYEADVVAQAEAVLARERGLLQRGVTTEAAVEQARMNLTQARQALRQRQLAIDNHEASLASLEAQRSRLNIALARQQDVLARAEPQAPFDARIAYVSAVEGQRVQAGQSLMSLYAPSSLAWRVIKPDGVPTTLRAGLEGELQPIVQTSDTVADGEVGRFAWFALPPDTSWVPGETRSARVYWPGIANTLLIPTSALYSGNRVFLVGDDERLASTVVSVVGVSRENGEEQWIIDASTLPEGSRILVTRLANIVPGMRVSVDQTWAPSVEADHEVF